VWNKDLWTKSIPTPCSKRKAITEAKIACSVGRIKKKKSVIEAKIARSAERIKKKKSVIEEKLGCAEKERKKQSSTVSSLAQQAIVAKKPRWLLYGKTA
jgi:hypothetical protein